MLGKLLPVLLAVGGTGLGVGAGLYLAPPPEETASEDAAPASQSETAPESNGDREYVRMTNQFVVPVMDETRVRALVVMSLSIEATPGAAEFVHSKEPKLRDAFLQVMFDHANVGGFEGAFTNGDRMAVLRRGLKDAAYPVLGDIFSDVLVTEIARQDV